MDYKKLSLKKFHFRKIKKIQRKKLIYKISYYCFIEEKMLKD